MINYRKKRIKSTIVWLVLFSLFLQMLPSPHKAMAFDLGNFLDKIFQKVQIPNEFEITERGGLKLGTETRNYLGMFDCLFKQSLDGKISFCGCDSSFRCGFQNNYGFQAKPSCTGEWRTGDVCLSPFSAFKLGEWQTDIIKTDSFGKHLAIPQAKTPRECQLKIPLPDDDFAKSMEEKSAHQAACNYFIALTSAASQEVFAVKKMYNNTDPLSECFFLKNCKSNCSLRFGEVRYDITVLDILRFLVPGGVFTYIQQIMTVVAQVQKIVKIASAFKVLLVDGALVLNDVYEIIQNFSALASAWQNMGLKWKDALSIITGPIGIYANRERLAKGYDGFLGLIQNFSNNMIEYSSAKALALQAADQSIKDLNDIITNGDGKNIAGFKNEPEIGFLFAINQSGKNGAENYQKRIKFDTIIKDYQNAFISIRGLLNNISAIGDVVGSQSIIDRGPSQQECQVNFEVYCTCHSKDKCRELDGNFDFDAFWQKNKEMTFIDFLKNNPALNQNLNEPKVQKCEGCWNNYKACELKYCPEGVPDTRFVVSVGKDFVTCTSDELRNGPDYCQKVAIPAAKDFFAQNNNCQGQNYFCDFGVGQRFRPNNINGITWLSHFKTAFENINASAKFFNLISADYLVKVIANALQEVKIDLDDDGTFDNITGYSMNQLDHTKAAWRIFWQDLGRAVLSPEYIRLLIIGDILSMQQKHKLLIQSVLKATSPDGKEKNSLLISLASLDNDYASPPSFQFDKEKYKKEPSCQTTECPLKLGFVSKCSFWTPAQTKSCLNWIFGEQLLEKFFINESLGNKLNYAMNVLAQLKLQQQTMEQSAMPYWLQAGFCVNNAADCKNLNYYTNMFEGSYRAEVAEAPDWPERIDNAYEESRTHLPDIQKAIMTEKLSPENSLLVYYLIKARKYFQDLADTNSANGYEQRIDNIMAQLKCGQAGGQVIDDCKKSCTLLLQDCRTECENHGDYSGGVSYSNCKRSCQTIKPNLPAGKQKWQETVEQFAFDNKVALPTFEQKKSCYDSCFNYCEDSENCPQGKNCHGGVCNTACQQAKQTCYREYCLNLPIENEACEMLKEIKKKLVDFFVSQQYSQFDEYLNQAKNILRSIEKEWAKSLPAGNEAVIARGYLEKTLNLIFHSQKLVANTKQQNIVCNRPDNNYLVLLDWQAPIPGLASLINELAGIIQEIIDLTNSPIFNSAHQSVKTELNNLTNELVSPVNLVRKNILDEIQTKIGSSYGCARGETGFLHKIACFEFDNQRKTCDLLYFIDVLDVFFASQEKITETKQAIELLKPQIKMEFSQQDPRKAVEMIKQEPLGKFPFWEDDGQTIKIAGIPIKGFADFKEAVNKNPIVFLTGLYNAIKKNLKTIRDELDKAQLKITKDEIFGKDPRKNNYVNPLVDFKSQNLTDLQRKVFGDDNLTAACKLISPILQSDPRNVWASCQNASYNLLGNTNLEKKCYTILQLDLSVLAMQPDEIQAEINRLTKQRKAAGVYDLQCPPKMNEAVRNGVCPTVNQGLNQNLDGQHLGNGTWCWPPTKQPLDKNDYTQGYQAVASFCRQTEERLNELGATGFDEICSLVNSAVADSLIKADAFIPNSACNNQTQANLDIMNNGVDVLLAKCSELESQKALEKECQYIQMLREHVFNGSCNLTACSQQENDDFANGSQVTKCKQRCDEAKTVLPKAFCSLFTNKKNCSLNDIPDLSLKSFPVELEPDCSRIDLEGDQSLTDQEKDLCRLLAMRDKALQACTIGAGNIKQPLDEVMKIFSILIGIRSATKLYNGVQTFVGDIKKMADSFSKLIKAIKGGGDDQSKTKGLLNDLEEAWNKIDSDSGSGGLTVSPLKCNAHPAESYSEIRKTKVSGPQGGPVCPDVTDFFGQVEAQFGLIRNNLRQIDLARKNIQPKYLPLPFKLNIHLFDKKEVVFPSLNNLHDLAGAIKQKAQFVWALAFAVNFSAKNCTCGESYCKMPFCISGLPLAFGPISNASCYLTWILRYPMLKIAESLENDLEAIE